nr:MAG TPA_asm: hypothetical protein [Caudoviricetes sp.]
MAQPVGASKSLRRSHRGTGVGSHAQSRNFKRGI